MRKGRDGQKDQEERGECDEERKQEREKRNRAMHKKMTRSTSLHILLQGFVSLRDEDRTPRVLSSVPPDAASVGLPASPSFLPWPRPARREKPDEAESTPGLAPHWRDGAGKERKCEKKKATFVEKKACEVGFIIGSEEARILP